MGDNSEAYTSHEKGTPSSSRNAKKTIFIKYPNLAVGGVQSVIAAQMSILTKADYEVILVLNDDNVSYPLPVGAHLEILRGNAQNRLDAWSNLLKVFNPSSYIDHSILYRRDWPEYANRARACGVQSVAWLHSYLARSILEFNTNLSFIHENWDHLDKVVVLSATDRDYYSAMGHKNVIFLPNPPSLLMQVKRRQAARTIHEQSAPNLLWAGRLNQSVKQVSDLILIMVEIVQSLPGAYLNIVGPASDTSSDQVRQMVAENELEAHVSVHNEVANLELACFYEQADIYLATSVIEGFPMSLCEANSYGLPIVMYELPWLWIAEANPGIIPVTQNDVTAAAENVVKLASDPVAYKRASLGGLMKVSQLRDLDFHTTYQQLLDRALEPPPPIDPVRIAHILVSIDRYYSRTCLQKSALLSEYSSRATQLTAYADRILEKNQKLQKENHKLYAELVSYRGVKRSARLLAGAIMRRLKSGKHRTMRFPPIPGQLVV